ncbi:uncharacterized protein LOC133524741 [Cydia pomonella]|uniref:uncharacterized protein LOC133524741 n=1 Tax=Cydia pomonella TaxID=82600 RepID=UPI002ADE1BFA|nr:uncharacterized protein LOC133524741 [Cydia pomonella]
MGLRSAPHERVIDLTVQDEIGIMNSIIEDPTLSTRRVGRIFNVPHAKVWRLWKRYGLHPYHYRKVQGLLPRDNFSRIVYCQRFNELLIQDPQLISKILWMDEAQFTRAGIINSKNYHHWADENPKLARESSFQYEFSVNMWAGVLNNRLIGPVEIPNRLNGDNYLEFIQNLHYLDCFGDVPLETLRTHWIQHDGAPAHFALRVRQHLNEHFPGRWIGRGSPTLAWPARSPDLTPLDFHIWGRLKERVYAKPVATREQLLQRIREEADTMRLTNVNLNREIRARLNVCLENEGGHFENKLQ